MKIRKSIFKKGMEYNLYKFGKSDYVIGRSRIGRNSESHIYSRKTYKSIMPLWKKVRKNARTYNGRKVC